MGQCCGKGPEEEPTQPQSASRAAGPAAAAAPPAGEGALPKSKRGLNAEQQETLNALFRTGVIESEDDVFKTDFSDGSMPPLHSQARKGNHVAVAQLLSLDKEKKSTRLVYGSRTPLHQAAAAKEGRIKTCKLLLDFDDWQLSQKTTDGRTPYHMASESDDEGGALVQLFLAKSGVAMLAEKRNNGSNCLHMACWEVGKEAVPISLVEMVKAVLKADASLLNVADGHKRTPLHLASMQGKTDVVKVLVDMPGVELAVKDSGGHTCIAHAATGGHADIVKTLIAKDKSLASIRDDAGKSPFDLAAEHGKKAGHWAAAAALLDADAKLISGSEGADAQSALHYAAQFGVMEGVKLILARDKGMLRSTNKDKNTPLHMAAAAGHLPVLTELIRANEGVGEPNAAGENLMHLACAGGHLEVVAALLKSHAGLATEKDAKGHTCLFSASLRKKPDAKVAKALLEAQPELLFSTDGAGKTVLHHVAEAGTSDDLIYLFVEKGGAKLVKTKDKKGEDVLANASPNCEQIIEDLLEREADELAKSPARVV